MTTRTIRLVLLTSIAGTCVLPSIEPVATPQFRTSVHVAGVQVIVSDSEGRPIQGLVAADFEVTIGKQRGSVVALDYVSVNRPRLADAAVTPREALPALAQDTSAHRSIAFLFDDLSFKPLGASELALPFERLLTLLDPDDRVSLTTTSGLGPNQNSTTNRESIASQLKQVRGRREDTAAPFFVGVDEALGTGNRTSSSNMIARECEIASLGRACSQMVAAAARREAVMALRRTENQIQSIRATIESMKGLTQPRILILVSDGIAAKPANELSQQLRAVSEAATSAGVRMYSLTGLGYGADVSDMSAERRSARISERRFLNAGVQTIAAAAGGESFMVVGQPERFLDRIVMETSAYYELAVQFDPANLSPSGFVPVRVKVNRRGATVRVRPLALSEGSKSRN